MMNSFYFICRTDIAESKGFPTGDSAALKDSGDYVLLGALPGGFAGQLTDIAADGFNPTNEPDSTGLSTSQLTARMNVARANSPAGKIVKITRVMGKWLEADGHPMLTAS